MSRSPAEPPRRADEGDRTQVVIPEDQDRVLRLASLSPGAEVAGRYRIGRRLGAGGAGEVFLAQDPIAGADVALKILYPHPELHTVARERLRRELRLVRGVNHPGVVRVHDIGEHDGLLFLVMELLRGETLRERLGRLGRLATPEAVRIAEGIFSALAAAHDVGVIHRDIKPGNIFLSESGGHTPGQDETAAGLTNGNDRVVLIDFGIARGNQDLTLTRTGALVGTLDYLSPEQARGEPQIGPAADLYSAGVVLYEMLTGVRPSRVGRVGRAQGRKASVFRKAREHDPPQIPAWLRDLFGWLLEVEPSGRPASAQEVLVRLRSQRRSSLYGRLRRRLGNSTLRSHRPGSRGPAVWALLGGAVIVAVAYPMSVETQPPHLIGRSLVGIRVRSWSTPGVGPIAVVPLDGLIPAGRHLVSLEPDRFLPPTPGFELGLGEIRPWWNYPRPFQLTDETFAPVRALVQDFPNYGPVWTAEHIAELPWPRVGPQQFLITFRHPTDFPSQLALIRGDGRIFFVVPHPGRLGAPMILLQARDAPPVAVIPGTNNHLGKRTVLLGIEKTTYFPAFPPFKVLASPLEEGPIRYYTPFSFDRVKTRLVQGGVELETRDSLRVRIDGRTGVPVKGEDRGNLSAEEWAACRADWSSTILTAVRMEKQGRPETAAATLLELAGRHPMPTVFRGSALGLAAPLLDRSGRLEDAVEAARRAAELEPEVSGHVRDLLRYLIRAGRWSEVRADLFPAASAARGVLEFKRDLVVGALLADDTSTARLVMPQSLQRGKVNSYASWSLALLALHEARPDQAMVILDNHEGARRDPWLAILYSLAFATRRPAAPALALHYLRIAESGNGTGQVVPFLPLRAYLYAQLGLPLPALTDIQGALERQHDAAFANIVDWYYVAWGEALTAAAYRLHGDLEAAARHEAVARSSPGRGAWLDGLLGTGR